MLMKQRKSEKKMSSSSSRGDWLSLSVPEYGEKFVGDVRSALGVLVLFSSLPIFWALYAKQASTWQFQANR